MCCDEGLPRKEVTVVLRQIHLNELEEDCLGHCGLLCEHDTVPSKILKVVPTNRHLGLFWPACCPSLAV